MIINQKDKDKSVRNFISKNIKLQKKYFVNDILNTYKKYIKYNKNHKKRYLTRKVQSPSIKKQNVNNISLKLEQFEQIKNNKNVIKIYNELLKNKIITKEIFDYIDFYCKLSGKEIGETIKEIHNHNQNIIKAIIIYNKYFILEKEQEPKEQIKEIKYKNNIIQQNKKFINCKEIFLDVLKYSRIEINQYTLLLMYNKFLKDLQQYINNNKINYINILKKIILLNNHQKNKLNENEIKMLAEMISKK